MDLHCADRSSYRSDGTGYIWRRGRYEFGMTYLIHVPLTSEKERAAERMGRNRDRPLSSEALKTGGACGRREICRGYVVKLGSYLV